MRRRLADVETSVLLEMDAVLPTADADRPAVHDDPTNPLVHGEVVFAEEHAGGHDPMYGSVKTGKSEAVHEPTWYVPVLMYHRIADAGPPRLSQWRVTPGDFQDQLRLLRAHGYRSTSSEEILRHRRANVPLCGRPVLITFDDGYADFADAAWPILEAHDFRAEVFLVTDLVGSSSSWDQALGPPAPLMDWPTIAGLADEGVTFGSHLATHTQATCLSSEELLDEAVRSRQTIASRLGTAVEAMALPYGAVDPTAEEILQCAGFGLGYSCDWGLADVSDPRFLVPRLEVSGHTSVEDLAHALGVADRPA
jgi:peptidoglycan/xylan/chitin deacetylase (PgdA/CDA1 family)